MATPALKSGGRDACGIDQSECPMDCLDQSECPIDCLDQSDIELGGFEWEKRDELPEEGARRAYNSLIS